MTTTIFRPRFSAIREAGLTRCMGSNHSDVGIRGICTTCLRDIVRVERKGRTMYYNVNLRYTRGDQPRYDYACWAPVHECDQEFAAKVYAERQLHIAEGKVEVLGQTVRVIRGRKIAKGTIGAVTWVGKDTNDYTGETFTKLRIVDRDSNSYFVRADYCEALTIPVTQPAVADEPKPVAAAAPRRSGSHADCTHESTKAARAACRKAKEAAIDS